MQKDTVYTGCMWQMTIVSTIEVDVHVHQRGRVQAFTVFVEDRHTEESNGSSSLQEHTSGSEAGAS